MLRMAAHICDPMYVCKLPSWRTHMSVPRFDLMKSNHCIRVEIRKKREQSFQMGGSGHQWTWGLLRIPITM